MVAGIREAVNPLSMRGLIVARNVRLTSLLLRMRLFASSWYHCDYRKSKEKAQLILDNDCRDGNCFVFASSHGIFCTVGTYLSHQVARSTTMGWRTDYHSVQSLGKACNITLQWCGKSSARCDECKFALAKMCKKWGGHPHGWSGRIIDNVNTVFLESH
jgi:hypothetical protein